MDNNSTMSSLGGLLSGSANLSDLPLTTLIFIVAVVAVVLIIAICKYDMIPGLDEKIPLLKGLCTKREVCFAGETCHVYDESSEQEEQDVNPIGGI